MFIKDNNMTIGTCKAYKNDKEVKCNLKAIKANTETL